MNTQFRVPEDFQPFDWRKDFWNYERNLSHWRRPGATYFPSKARHRQNKVTLWRAAPTVERVFQPVLQEDANANSLENDPW